MNTPTENVLRIRGSLGYLSKVDRHVLKAVDALNEIFLVPQKAGEDFAEQLKKKRTYEVKDKSLGGGKTQKFTGRMTDNQNKFLDTADNKASFQAFADAVANLILVLDRGDLNHTPAAPPKGGAGRAIDDLRKALQMIIAEVKILFPPLGTCTYDDNQTAHCSEAACEDGLLGTWVEG